MTRPSDSLTRQVAPWRDILDIPVADLDYAQALDCLSARIVAKLHTPVAFLNANNANIAIENPELAVALDRFVILSDGLGVDIAARILHGAIFKANLNGTDFIPALFAHCKNPLKVGLIGAQRKVVDAACSKFATEYPNHQFQVISDGYFKPGDEDSIRQRAIEYAPDIVLVAMGVPRQEFFMTRVLGPGTCTMPIAVGALFDLHTGSIPRAPQWMRATRTEWVFRMWKEPKRLWRRYMMGNPLFLARVLRCRLTGRSRGGGEALGVALFKRET
ncbi:MAG: WecB/TagA/CpsF family glycosyltransferase [Rhizobiaceae bacterium]